MSTETFTELGKTEAVNRLYDGCGYTRTDISAFEASNKGNSMICSSVMMVEGIDFDLTYFPLKHLGYKAATAATGELYASMSHPRTMSVRLAVSAKLDYGMVREIWEGITSAAKKYGYESVALDLVPSTNGLYICISSCGERNVLTSKRRMPAKSMDLICISGNLGGAYMGMRLMEREKKKFMESKEKSFKPDLEEYRHMVGEYLKPEINPSYVSLLEEEEIIPSYGYLTNKGLSDAVKRLVRDSGLGAKIYVEKIPFSSKIFDLGKEMDIDPVTAAFNGGDDFRLLFTIPIGKHERFRHDFQTFDIIGHLARPEVGAVLVTPEGVELPLKAQGWK